MSETDDHQKAMTKWSSVLYGLVGLYAAVLSISIFLGENRIGHLVEALILLLPVVVADRKSSRAGGIALVLLATEKSLLHLTHLQDNVDGANWALLATALALVLAGVKFSVAAVQFHRVAKTQVIWCNAFINTLVTLAYIWSWVYFAARTDNYFPDHVSLNTSAFLILAGPLLIVALAAWRILPGTRSRLVVVPAGVDIGKETSISFPENANWISLSKFVQGRDRDGYVVRPSGHFGKSYFLRAGHFEAYWEEKRDWVFHGRMDRLFALGLFSAVAIAYIDFGYLDRETIMDYFVYYIIAIAMFLHAFDIWNMGRQFRRQFPNAPVAKALSGRIESIGFDFGAGVTGKAWVIVPCIILFLLSAFVSAGLIVAALQAEETVSRADIFYANGLCLLFLISPITAILGKRRFRERYGLPLTAENLWKVRSGESTSPESR